MPLSSPGPDDDALLARLNALKKSSVTLDTTPSASIPSPTPPAPSSAPAPTDDLAVRFARLGSASPAASPKPSKHESGSSGPPVMAPGAASYLEGIAEGIGGGGTEANVADEKSLEELLEEIEGKEQFEEWEKEDFGKLVREARTLLPAVKEEMDRGRRKEGGAGQEGLTDWENVEVDIGSSGEQDDSDKGKQEQKKTLDDQEADELVAQAMQELDINWKFRHGDSFSSEEDSVSSNNSARGQTQPDKSPSAPPVQDKDGEDDDEDKPTLQLPSAPDTLPKDDLDATQALEDALVARFASLHSPSPSQSTDSLSLPSAPSFAPSNKPPKITKSKFTKFSDKVIETWCVICNDDATLKCLGCDGDLYCRNCWMEGHRGESAGFEERRHKAVVYNKGEGDGGGGGAKEKKVALGAG
ncbi:hypothetical protein BCR34DRAFT_620879 [Clohesyomyces aquaticus]|uniref:Uncharacterized protein n=1 Tax=Clohesyomyces aquaticus TaxID=1231657 RepID=A0A1Y2AA40_9PLEO|nr:hypothetical protein BCR34DRAFT_620879 [Clohesyomyces aquaticus]